MAGARFLADKGLVYCICPNCKAARKKVEGRFTIIRRGKERSGVARFFCLNCRSWFNERTGKTMPWMGRV